MAKKKNEPRERPAGTKIFPWECGELDEPHETRAREVASRTKSRLQQARDRGKKISVENALLDEIRTSKNSLSPEERHRARTLATQDLL